MILGCIADDSTGATDLANTLVRHGMRSVQLIGVPEPDLVVGDVDAVVIALKSRTNPAAEAVRRLAAKHSAVLLANHGPVAAGRTLEAALYATEELEETARLYLLLHGRKPRCLTSQQVQDLQNR